MNDQFMNVHVLIPLVATLAYIPLLVIVLQNRPWQPRQKLFFFFLIPAMLWSATDIFFRSDSFGDREQKLFLVKIVLFCAVWMILQYRYFLQSFYKSDVGRKPFAYAVLVAYVGLAAANYIPNGITLITDEVTRSVVNIHVDYGLVVVAIAAVILVITARDMYNLVRILKVSDNVEERNQVIYLLLGLGCLAISGLVTFRFSAEGTPVGHIGNFLNACILTYAVVAHRLLDVRVMFRRAVSWLALGLVGVGIYVSLFLLAYHKIEGVDVHSIRPEIVAAAAGIAVIAAVSVYKLLNFFSVKVEQAFVGTRYTYRKKLSDFVTKIHSVPTLEQFGHGLISLLSQSVGCDRACLLLPVADGGSFRVRFVYPAGPNNPMEKLELRLDSPVVTWLKSQKTVLAQGYLAIFPEFQSMWQKEKEAIQLAGVGIFVPLMNRGELVAVMGVGVRGSRKSYAVEDINLLQSIASQVAASMEKEYFHEQLREQDREITLINRLTTIITSSVSVQEIFDGFAQELKEIIDVDWAAIALIDGGEVCLSALAGSITSPWQRGESVPLAGTGTERVCRDKKSLYEADLMRYHKFWTDEHYSKEGIRSIVYLPLTVKDQGIGSLILGSVKPDSYDQRQIKLLEQVARHIATPVENAQLYARAEQRARIDELTGLFNRRHFEERLKEEIARHSRRGDAFSLLLLDLDSFKTYNDIYGHPAGDFLLSQLGKTIKSSIRDADQAFRYGGDEFAIILPLAAMNDGYVVAERIRAQIARDMAEKEIAVTCSIGVATYPADGVVSGELVTVADTALYYAKRTGGNRVYLSSRILSDPLDNAGTYARHNGLSAVYALVSAVEAKDPYTYGHSRKVNTYAVALAEAAGLSPEEVSRVSTAALLHDIGKIGVADRVLNKKGKLTKADWEAIKSHPRLGATIVGNIPNLAPCVSTILHHHERWDGSGYPEGLKGEQISVEARILAIADAFEAMSAARPYRRALCGEKVLRELRRGAGSQFDPELVEIFIGIVEGGFPEEARVASLDQPPGPKTDALRSV